MEGRHRKQVRGGAHASSSTRSVCNPWVAAPHIIGLKPDDKLLLFILGSILVSGCKNVSPATPTHHPTTTTTSSKQLIARLSFDDRSWMNEAGWHLRASGSVLKPPIRRHRRATYGTRQPTTPPAEISQAELIELLAELYAYTELSRRRLNVYQNQTNQTGEASPGPEERHQLEMRLGADQESIRSWLRERQDRFSQPLREAKFELLREYPNGTINVCPDGPKILVMPDVSSVIYCYTREQWIERLWADLRLAYYHYPIVVLNVLIFLIGTTGNIFVCLSVYRNHSLRNVTNYFIVNLAAADLFVILICLPATQVWDLSLTWFFGTIPCKLIMFLQDVSISVSVLTLTAISVDRYYAICHPLRFKSSLSEAKRIILLIWLASMVAMSPDLVYLSAHPSQELLEAGLDTVLYSDCNYDWTDRSSKLFQFIKTFFLYLLPFSLMFCAHYVIMRTLWEASADSFCEDTHQTNETNKRRPSECCPQSLPLVRLNSEPAEPGALRVTMHNKDKLESRRKAAKMLTAIVVIFGICYLPVHLINSLRQFIDNIPQTELASALSMLAHCACYLNSAINPIIYNHMNSIFRAEFRKFLLHCTCRRQRKYQADRETRLGQSIKYPQKLLEQNTQESSGQMTVVEMA